MLACCRARLGHVWLSLRPGCGALPRREPSPRTCPAPARQGRTQQGLDKAWGGQDLAEDTDGQPEALASPLHTHTQTQPPGAAHAWGGPRRRKVGGQPATRLPKSTPDEVCPLSLPGSARGYSSPVCLGPPSALWHITHLSPAQRAGRPQAPAW